METAANTVSQLTQTDTHTEENMNEAPNWPSEPAAESRQRQPSSARLEADG